MKDIFRIYFAFALALILAACGGAATPAPEKPASPLTTVSMDDRIIASIDANEHPLASPTLSGNHPDEIAFANGFIWTRTDNGHVIQIDLSMNTMVSAVKTDTTSDPFHYCQGLGTDGKDIWACSAAGDEDHTTINVVRVDTSTQSVVETIEIGKIHDQLIMPFAQNQIWVLTGDGSKLVGIDVSNNQPNPPIDLGIRCFQLAALDNAIFATCGLDNLVIKIDPEKKEVVAQQNLQNPRNISVAKTGLWVSQGNSITYLDPESLNPIVTFTGITESDINVTNTAVWVWEYGKGILYKIDPNTNEISELIKPDNPFITGGSVLVTEDSIWLTVNENDLVLRLRLK